MTAGASMPPDGGTGSQVSDASTPSSDHASRTRVPDAHFEHRYRAETDPWKLEVRWYERRKRALTTACLGRERYRRAFEPACATGLLTLVLAQRCDELLAVDASPTAVAAARRRTADLARVRVATMAVPDDWPAGRFDLIVLSEVGYYLDVRTVAELRDLAIASLTEDGELLAVHYRPAVPEHVIDGDTVHDVLRAAAGVRPVLRHVEEHFLLDGFVRDTR